MCDVDDKITLVPLPTIGRHIRERGFDHISLFCKKTGYPVEHVIEARNNTVQVGANKRSGEQAKAAYAMRWMLM